MKSFFTAEFFKGNRERLRKLVSDGKPIVITANGVMQRNSDVTYPFRQDSSFWYLTGINVPDVILVMTEKEDFLIIPTRDAVIELFDGKADVNTVNKASGIKRIFVGAEGWQKLGTEVKSYKKIATLLPLANYMKFHGFYSNPSRAALMRRLKGIQPKLEIEDIRSHMMSLRIIKQKAEVMAIQHAVDITCETLTDIKRNLQEYSFEYEIEAAINEGFRKRGANSQGFESIVASGSNACQIHYVSNNDALHKNGLVLLDVSAEVENYSADISRTYAINKPSKRQQEIYQAVKDVQDYGISLAKPGISFKEHDEKTRLFMGEKLIQLGLIKAAEKEAINKYYPHYSHFLGLDTHDIGDYSIPFEPGTVITVEPGIYIPEERIGVRIEDDVLITEKGAQVLSTDLPRSLT